VFCLEFGGVYFILLIAVFIDKLQIPMVHIFIMTSKIIFEYCIK
jgi:hypothetical protein